MQRYLIVQPKDEAHLPKLGTPCEPQLTETLMSTTLEQVLYQKSQDDTLQRHSNRARGNKPL